MTAGAPPLPSREALLPLGAGVLGVTAVVFGYWYPGAPLLTYAYPAAAVLVGAVLFVGSPGAYLGFTWWIWLVTPFVRRLADHQAHTFTEASPIMLTPYLVTGLCAVTLVRLGGRLTEARFAPFRLALLGVGYAYLVGVARAGVFAATFDLLEWAAPLLIAFHVLALWRLYPEHRRATRTALTWGVLVLGTYGVIQFVAPPVWDAQWVLSSGMASSIGQPESYAFRVFSMLNSPGPFAMVMMAGLLLLLGERGPLARVAMVPGYASFLLALVRGAWGGWLIGVVHAALGLRGLARKRLLVVLVIGSVTLLPLATFAPAAERLGDRFETLSSLSEDRSFNARVALYVSTTGRALTEPIGLGLGSLGRAAKLGGGGVVSLDSGLLALPLTLGWIGTALYVAGLVGLLRQALAARRRTADPFAVTACAIAVAYLSAMVFANQVTGVKGVVLWTFLAFAAAAGAQPSQSAPRPGSTNGGR